MGRTTLARIVFLAPDGSISDRCVFLTFVFLFSFSDVPFFAEALETYTREIKMAEGIVERHPLGMLLVDAQKLKSLMIPSPNRCLDVINDILPVKARKEVDRLITELQDAQFKLEIEPTTTLEFVQSLTFLDEIQERIDPLQAEAQVVVEMYELIEQFKVPYPPEDFAVYQTLNTSVNAVLNAIDKSLAERDQNVDKFCSHLDKDIAELGREVKEVKEGVQHPSVLDAASDGDQVCSYPLHSTRPFPRFKGCIDSFVLFRCTQN